MSTVVHPNTVPQNRLQYHTRTNWQDTLHTCQLYHYQMWVAFNDHHGGFQLRSIVDCMETRHRRDDPHAVYNSTHALHEKHDHGHMPLV